MDGIARFQASLPAATGINKNPVNRQDTLKQAARDFEAMMVEQMLKSMRQASEVMKEDSLTGSREQDFWQEWQDGRLAQEMVKGRGLGLAEQIIRQVNTIEGTTPQ